MISFIQPLMEHTSNYIATINGVRIRLCLNTDDVLQYVVPQETYEKADPIKIAPVEFTLNLLITDSIPRQYMFHRDNENSGQISETEVIYPNRRYVLGNATIEFYQYPNHSVHIKTIASNSITVLTGNQYVLIFFLKFYIKQIVSEKNGATALHASAVGKECGAIAFLGHGNAGKSTIAYNLSTCGWAILHDDLIFIEEQDKDVLVRGVQVNPCLRRAALPYVLNDDKIVRSQAVFENKYHECFYLRNMTLIKESFPLKAIILLSTSDFSNEKPQAITTDTDWVLQSYIKDPVCRKMIEKLPVYGINRNLPIKQKMLFLNTLL